MNRIMAKESDQAELVPNYHLYLVFSAMSVSPRILPMEKPNLKGLDFSIQPLNFGVTHSGNPK